MDRVQTWEYSCSEHMLRRRVKDAQWKLPYSEGIFVEHPCTYATVGKMLPQLYARVFVDALRIDVRNGELSQPAAAFSPVCWADDGKVFVFQPPWRQLMAQEQPFVGVSLQLS